MFQLLLKLSQSESNTTHLQRLLDEELDKLDTYQHQKTSKVLIQKMGYRPVTKVLEDERNAIIQMLFFNTEFKERFLSLDVSSPVAHSLQKLFVRLEAGITAIQSKDFLKALCEFWRQDSVAELLNMLFPCLKSELAKTAR
jgi:hypothetical protein